MNDKYVVIQGFMVEEMGLKGNELMVYAIIYGFSQAKDNRFTGSLQYLADWTRSTKQGVLKNLKSLLDKGYIRKVEGTNHGVKYVEYYATEFNGVLNSVEQGYSTEFNGGIKLSLPNNIYNNITDNKENNISPRTRDGQRKPFVPPTVEQVRAYCVEKNLPLDPVRFVQYYEAADWTDSKGKPVKNWKQKALMWEGGNRNGSKPISATVTESAEEKRRRYNIHYDNE